MDDNEKVNSEDESAELRRVAALVMRAERFLRFVGEQFPDLPSGLLLQYRDGKITVTVHGPDDLFDGKTLDAALTKCLHSLENDR